MFSILSFHIVWADHIFGLDGKFLGSQGQSFLGKFHGYSFAFEHDATGFYHGSPEFQVTLSFTHTHFLRFAGYWLIGENTDPDVSFPLHMTGHGLSGGFNLPVRNPFGFQSFQAEGSKGNGRASLGVPSDSSF